ncbi:MAG TPA: tetratricopeptide repeat protein [Candidatus Saccharimonadaceae bacterium]|jgi:tetratricopeptide (TPR) repeat protein|nr:tetratricopeptide repeat protein [Candidatus Saccharimonadaceae bacterium]
MDRPSLARRAWRLAAPAALAALAFVSGPARGESADARAEGDALYAHGRFADARARYQAALAGTAADFTTLCRLARVESEMGEDLKGEERRSVVASAVEHARAAVKIAPDSAQGHVWLAVALGRQALKEGPRGKLALAREIKSEADRGLAIDPNIGRAHHVLAVWNREVASLNFMERAAANTVLGGVPEGASMDNAVRELERAVQLEPDYVNHRLELGRTYRMLKRWADARRELEKAVTLAPTSNPRDALYQAEARQLLARLPKS